MVSRLYYRQVVRWVAVVSVTAPRLCVTRLRFERKTRYFLVGGLYNLTAVDKFLQQCGDFLISVG